jgi:hypothetical protein
MCLIGSVTMKARTGRRVSWLSGLAHKTQLQRCIETMTVPQLEHSRRPLLFSLLAGVLRGAGSTRESPPGAFPSIDPGRDRASAIIVSSERWGRALATSHKLAARRRSRREHR